MTMTDDTTPESQADTAPATTGNGLTETLAGHQGLDIAMSDWTVSSFTDWSNGGQYTGFAPTSAQPTEGAA